LASLKENDARNADAQLEQKLKDDLAKHEADLDYVEVITTGCLQHPCL
jgi:hypothetical protein